MSNKQKPRVLVVDIETAPILAYVWDIWDQTVGLNQIKRDWFILSFAAKWLDSPEKEIIYFDQRNEKNIEDNKKLLGKIWKLMDEADILLTQNGQRFDVKKLNAKFLEYGFQPPSSFRQIDTLKIAKKHFAFTSNKLEYLTNLLNTKYKKLKHDKFSGFELWKQCLQGNKKAWVEMERYNKYDILALEELYHKLIPWDNSINFNLYSDSTVNTCKCGNKEFKKNGYFYSSVGKYQRYKCTKCGSETRDRNNLFSKEKSKSLKK